MNAREIMQLIKDRLQGKAKKGQRRSPLWRQVRHAHLLKHPECEGCGRKTKLEVHHVVPFSVAPDKELDPTNLITLCENKKNGINCHLAIGHLGDYRRFNPYAKADAMYWRLRLARLDANNPI